MMAAVSTSETSVIFYQTTRLNIPEDIFILVAVRSRNLTKQVEFDGVNWMQLTPYRSLACPRSP
jgi:hypothetical protein